MARLTDQRDCEIRSFVQMRLMTICLVNGSFSKARLAYAIARDERGSHDDVTRDTISVNKGS
jgi:hypothetical protein